MNNPTPDHLTPAMRKKLESPCDTYGNHTPWAFKEEVEAALKDLDRYRALAAGMQTYATGLRRVVRQCVEMLDPEMAKELEKISAELGTPGGYDAD